MVEEPDDALPIALAAALPEAWATPRPANDLVDGPPAPSSASRAMRGFAYDAATRVLRVEWASGNVYELEDVPPSIAQGLDEARSKGRYFRDWLRDRYQLHERLPACWYAHGPLIEELSALRSAWVGTFLDPQARLDEPLHWHEQLERFLERFRSWDRTGCADGTHRPEQPLQDDTDHSHRERAIFADLAGRDADEGEAR